MDLSAWRLGYYSRPDVDGDVGNRCLAVALHSVCGVHKEPCFYSCGDKAPDDGLHVCDEVKVVAMGDSRTSGNRPDKIVTPNYAGADEQ
jgi:hypothetical protein